MQTIRRGDYLYDEGEDSSAFYVVLSGSLKDLGTAVIKSDGEVLGFDDYSLTRPRHAAVVALVRRTAFPALFLTTAQLVVSSSIDGLQLAARVHRGEQTV